ncbi:MAG: hypothetical protein XD52_0654, partial [bacterium 42_11]
LSYRQKTIGSDCVVYVISLERREQRIPFHFKEDGISCAGL